MPLLDIFSTDAFGVIEMTEAINVRPNVYGRLQEMNLFPGVGIRGRVAAIERKNGTLNLLPTVPVGGPATKGIRGKRDLRMVPVPHIPHEDLVLAEDVQGVRAFGSDSQVQSFQDLLNDVTATMAAKHDITLEYLRWGALKGVVLDADGTTLIDWFAEFGVTPEVQTFALTTSGTEVVLKVLALKRYMEDNLFGETMTGVHVFASSGFMDLLTTHTNVKEAYKYFQSTQQQGGDYRKGFNYGGVTFEEHNGTAVDMNGNVRRFIPVDEAIAIPLGTSMFKTYFAPADFIETVNTPGLPRYAKQVREKYDRGIEVHTQSNPLPVVLRPQLIVRLTKA